jgi:DNA-binding MarR family transcriptional regulator
MSKSKAVAAGDLWLELLRLFFSRKDRVTQLANEHGLTPGHLQALMSLDPDASRPMSQLAQAWRCDASNVTFMVDRLEERGYVHRQTSATDRRVKTVVLTPAGVTARQEIHEMLTAPPPELLKLPLAELERLTELLAKVDIGTVNPAGFWAKP